MRKTADWKTTEEGLRICTINPAKTAYKILKVLEEDRIPHGEVGNIWKTLQDILAFTEIAHSPEMEENPNWPR